MSGKLPCEHETQDLIQALRSVEDAVRVSVIPLRRRLFQNFLSGIAYTIGTLIAVAVVVPLIMYFLKDIEWVPLIGDFVDRVIEQVQETSR